MKRNTIKNRGRSDYVDMGPIQLRQPLPSNEFEIIDPFILLHHYGPYEINEAHNPFDLGPHPHRGFEPVTFLIQGEQLHRDSLGNESVVKAGDVQWTTAGRGIIHAESPSKAFVKQGGTIEGIQLWLNLPAEKKMITPNYQHGKSEDFNTVVNSDGTVHIKVIAGRLEDQNGKIATQTSVNAFMIDMKPSGEYHLKYSQEHQGLIYLINGNVTINDSEMLKLDDIQMVQFNSDGEGVVLKSETNSKLLFLSGTPLDEKVTSWGPYVMNTQTEILEAMRDYQMGKMGFLPAN